MRLPSWLEWLFPRKEEGAFFLIGGPEDLQNATNALEAEPDEDDDLLVHRGINLMDYTAGD